VDMEPEERFLSTSTLSLHPRKLEELRGMIREFRDRLIAFTDTEKGTEVFNFNIQLFPISKNIQE
jgi:uncharacterized protein (TIGR02147 family)